MTVNWLDWGANEDTHANKGCEITRQETITNTNMNASTNTNTRENVNTDEYMNENKRYGVQMRVQSIKPNANANADQGMCQGKYQK